MVTTIEAGPPGERKSTSIVCSKRCSPEMKSITLPIEFRHCLWGAPFRIAATKFAKPI